MTLDRNDESGSTPETSRLGEVTKPRSDLWDDLLRAALLGEGLECETKDEDGARPTRLGRFLLGREIGRGGMGVVYEAVDRSIDRTVAVKVLRASRRSTADGVQRFLREARILGALQHPGIVPIHELADTDDPPWFAMKLISGTTLAQRLACRRDAIREIEEDLVIFEKIADALGFAHSRDVVHRDMKPSNVMVGAFGEVQILDWGLSKVVGVNGTPAIADDLGTEGKESTPVVLSPETATGEPSQSGSVIGTPAYMSPEQATGCIEIIDARSDVFALGSILCEILTGSPAYRGETPIDLRAKAAAADLDDAHQRLAACGAPTDIVATVLKCLDPEPARRFHNAAAVAEAISTWRRHRAESIRLAAIEVEKARARAEAAEEIARETQSRIEAERRSRRLRTMVAFLLLGFASTVTILRLNSYNELLRRETTAERTFDAALSAAAILRAEASIEGTKGIEKLVEARTQLDVAAAAIGGIREPAKARRRLDAKKAEYDATIASLRIEHDREKCDTALVEDLNRFSSYQFIRSGAFDSHASPECEVLEVFRKHGYFAGDVQRTIALIQSSRFRQELIDGLESTAFHKGHGHEIRSLIDAVDRDPIRQSVRSALQDRKFDVVRRLLIDEGHIKTIGPGLSLIAANRLRLDADDAVGARSIIDRALDKFPGNYRLLVALSRITVTDFPEDMILAASSGLAAASLNPHQPQPWVYAHKALKRLGNKSMANRARRGLLGALATQALDPIRRARHLGLASCLEDAISIQLSETNSGIAAADLADFHRLRGLAFRELQRPDDALRELRLAVEVSPDIYNLSDLFVVLDESGNQKNDSERQEITRKLDSVSALDLDDNEAKFIVAQSLVLRGRNEDALRILSVNRGSRPLVHSRLTCLIGTNLRILSRDDECLDFVSQLIAVKMDCSNCHENLAWVLMRRSRLSEALHHAKMAVTLLGDISVSGVVKSKNITLASVAARAKDYACEMSSGEVIIKLTPGDYRGYAFVGEALFALSRFANAVEFLDKALELNPVDCGSLLHRFRCALALDRVAEARPLLQRVINTSCDAHIEVARNYLQDLEKIEAAHEKLHHWLVEKNVVAAQPTLDQMVDVVNVLTEFGGAATAFSTFELFVFPRESPGESAACNEMRLTALAAATEFDATSMELLRALRRKRALVVGERFIGRMPEIRAKGLIAWRNFKRTLEWMEAAPDLVALRAPAELSKLEPPESARWRALWESIAKILDAADD